MLDVLRRAAEHLREAVTAIDDVRDDQVSLAVEAFAEIERLATAGRTLMARRVEKGRVWVEAGYRTPAQWMASHAQTTMGAAIVTLETARRLDALPATREAFSAGVLSGLQAAEITRAAAMDPASEPVLLDSAKSESVAGLREKCRSVVAAAERDAAADERRHRSRSLRHWLDADGMVRLDARLTPDAGAPLIAVIEARSRMLREQARRAGFRERREAYAADALASLVEGSAPGPAAVVHVHVDETAWSRGRLERDESCRISGIGPVSVAAARRLAKDGIVKTVLADGADVRAVAHLGRTIPARLRTALEARDQNCVVPGCDEREGLEIDHIVPFAEGGPTSLDNLARLCHHHHARKTHRGWQLAGGPGRWEWSKRARASTRAPPG